MEEKGSGLFFLVNNVKQLFQGCDILEVVDTFFWLFSELLLSSQVLLQISLSLEEHLKSQMFFLVHFDVYRSEIA